MFHAIARASSSLRLALPLPALGAAGLRLALPARAAPAPAALRRLQSSAPRPERLFAAYRVRKPEAQLELAVRHAKFRGVGAQGNFYSPSQEGSVRLSLSPAAGAPAPGASFPPYEYAAKIFVDVSALDIVTIIQSPIAQPVRAAAAAATRLRLPPPLSSHPALTPLSLGADPGGLRGQQRARRAASGAAARHCARARSCARWRALWRRRWRWRCRRRRAPRPRAHAHCAVHLQ